MSYEKPWTEKLVLVSILLAVAFCAYAVASCFAGTIQRHVFEAGVAFDEAGKVVVSTETIRGEW